MRALETGLQDLLGNDRHRFADLWKLIRTDGASHRFTNHNRQIEYADEIYTPVGGFISSDMVREADLRERSQEFQGPFATITFDDMRTRTLQGAKVIHWKVDHRFPFLGAFSTEVLWITRGSFNPEQWKVDLVGLTRRLRQKVGFTYGRMCRHELGSNHGISGKAGCKVDIEALSFYGATVGAVTDRQVFAISLGVPAGLGDHYFQFGKLIWLTGTNKGAKHAVLAYAESGQAVTLSLPAGTTIQGGDRFNIEVGCDQTSPTCKSRFTQPVGAVTDGNFDNYGGQLFMPGTDGIIDSVDS